MTANERESSHWTDDTQQPTDTDRLREAIDRAKISQRAAARELGVDDRTMRYWCSGDQAPPPMARRALDPRVRLAEMRREAIELNLRQIEMLESGQMTGGSGPGLADGGGNTELIYRLRQKTEELQVLMRLDEAFLRRQEALFVVNQKFSPGNGQPTMESLEELEAAEKEWREAQSEADRIVQGIRSGYRR